MSNSEIISSHIFSLLKEIFETKEVFKVERKLADFISAIDIDAAFCHVEYPDEHNKLDYIRIWEIRAWRSSLEKWDKLRKQDEISRKLWHLRKLQIEKLIAGIADTLQVPQEQAKELAENIVERKNFKAAKSFSVNLEEIVNEEA